MKSIVLENLVGHLAVGAREAAGGAERVGDDASVDVELGPGDASQDREADAREEETERAAAALVLLQVLGSAVDQDTWAESAANTFQFNNNI